jgi:hypothetical protein
MTWADSHTFRAFWNTVLTTPAEALDLDTDTFKAALYNNSITPDNDAAQASTCYNTGAWALANEVTSVGEWDAGGVALTTPTVNIATADTVFWDAVDTASAAGATLADVHGCLVYDDTSTTPSDQGVCFNYFGGANSVTNGTFTIVWHANGIFRMTV